MVWINPGTFLMGSRSDEPGSQSNENPQVWVTLTRGFWVGAHEVTQGDYVEVMGSNPSAFKTGLNMPVESVTWFAAVEYCVALTGIERAAGRIPENWEYRLPTEAEWEYCCRAGATTTRYAFGDDPSTTLVNSYAWHSTNSGGSTHPVGEKLPNAWGLGDMHGNLSEWCRDRYGVYPGGAATDPVGPEAGTSRVLRGGSWAVIASGGWLRSAVRYDSLPDVTGHRTGFRVVLAENQS
jgi:formylglycine-generating enzyme required for sulfatase activity